MNVEIILKTKGSEVATTKPGTTLVEVARELATRKIGALVVSADGSTVDGRVSERDIVRSVADAGAAALDKQVSSCMTRDVFTCKLNDSVQELMSTMSQKRIRHLPVTKDGKLCGMISIGDVVKYRLEEVEYEAEALRGFIAGG